MISLLYFRQYTLLTFLLFVSSKCFMEIIMKYFNSLDKGPRHPSDP